MPSYGKMPDGTVVAIPDDATPKELAELQLQYDAMQKKVEAAKPSVLGQVGHAVGVNLRALATGALSLPAMGGDAIAAASNKLLGTNFPNQSQNVQNLMTKIGLPEPQSWQDKVAMFGSSAAGGAAWNGPINSAVRGVTGSSAPLYNAPAVESVGMQSLRQGREAGYKVTPGAIEKSGGKAPIANVGQAFSGKANVDNMAMNANANVTNNLARKAAGLPPESPLTSETLNNAIRNTYETGYGPIAKLGEIPALSNYHQSLDDIAQQMHGMSRSFPGAARSDVADLVDSYRVQSMHAEDALRAISQLRDQSSAAYAAGNAPLAGASKAVAKALEDNIEHYLTRSSSPASANPEIPTDIAKNILSNFRNARTQLAKQYTVRSALSEGSGNVNATKIGALLTKKPEYLTDELKTIGQFANAAPKIAGIPKDASPSFTGMEGMSLLGSGLASLAGAGPAGHIAAAIPVARAAIRHGIMSDLGQSMMMGAPPGAPLIPGTAKALALGTGLYGLGQ